MKDIYLADHFETNILTYCKLLKKEYRKYFLENKTFHAYCQIHRWDLLRLYFITMGPRLTVREVLDKYGNLGFLGSNINSKKLCRQLIAEGNTLPQELKDRFLWKKFTRHYDI